MSLVERPICLENGHTIGTYRVRYQDCNVRGHLHLHRLMDLAQDTDDHSSQLIHAKVEQLEERGFCWILNANTVSFVGELPKAEDQLIVDSWFRGTRGVRFLRENRYYRNTRDEKGFIGSASSTWIICTCGDHRPLRPLSVIDGDQVKAKADDAIGNMDKIPRLTSFLNDIESHEVDPLMKGGVDGEFSDMPGDGDRGEMERQRALRDVIRYQVQLGDLDSNKHLHNSNYVKLAIDAVGAYLAIDVQNEEPVVRRFHIQFVNEVKLFEHMAIYVIPDPASDRCFLIEGRTAESNEVAFLATAEIERQPY